MSTAYSVEFDTAQVAEAQALFEFVGGNTDEALRVAINRAAPRVRTLASSRIRTQVRLSASYVANRLTVTKATRKVLSGRIGTPSRGLLLSRFSTDALIAGDKVGWIKPPEPPPLGIRVKIKPDQPPKVVHGDSDTAPNKPFYVVLNKGQNVGIAARYAGQGRGGRKFKVFSGPSLSQVFDTVRDDVLPEASDVFQAELLDAMRYLLAKQYPPAE